jgi:hypothetical protein
MAGWQGNVEDKAESIFRETKIFPSSSFAGNYHLAL